MKSKMRAKVSTKATKGQSNANSGVSRSKGKRFYTRTSIDMGNVGIVYASETRSGGPGVLGGPEPYGRKVDKKSGPLMNIVFPTLTSGQRSKVESVIADYGNTVPGTRPLDRRRATELARKLAAAAGNGRPRPGPK